MLCAYIFSFRASENTHSACLPIVTGQSSRSSAGDLAVRAVSSSTKILPSLPHSGQNIILKG